MIINRSVYDGTGQLNSHLFLFCVKNTKRISLLKMLKYGCAYDNGSRKQ